MLWSYTAYAETAENTPSFIMNITCASWHLFGRKHPLTWKHNSETKLT